MAKMNKDIVERKIKMILADHLDIHLQEITNHASLRDDLGLDSFGAVEFIFELENKFELKIPDEDLKNIKTVSDVVKYITSQVLKKKGVDRCR